MKCLIKHQFMNQVSYYDPIKNCFLPDKYYFKPETVQIVMKWLRENKPNVRISLVVESDV